MALEEVPVAFARVLRGAGLAVPVGSTVTFARALATGAPPYWAGRATLVRRPEDVPTYDRAFAAFFGGGSTTGAAGMEVHRTVEVAVDADDAEPDAGDDRRDETADDVRAVRFSATEVLRGRDLAECSAE